MGTVIMLFIIPLGVLVYFWDRRNYDQNLAIYRDYILQVKDTDLPDAQKMDKIDEMFYQNGYTRIERSNTHLIIEKKHFSIGLLLICVGLLTYFGLVIYFLYYRFFLKPRRLRVDLEDETIIMTCEK